MARVWQPSRRATIAPVVPPTPPRGVRGLDPGRPLVGRLRPPGSKSLAQRALVCAALADGRTRVEGLSDGEDVRAALAALRAVGAELDELAPGALSVVGRSPAAGGWRALGPVAVGESGTLARLVTAALGLAGAPGAAAEVRPAGSLRRRASTALVRALAGAGCAPRSLAPGGTWPLALRAAAPPAEVLLVEPGSSQEASALLIALAAHEQAGRLRVRGPIPSRPYLEMTLAVLARFGARVARAEEPDGERFDLRGPLVAPAQPFALEADASAAAVALAAGCLSGGAVTVEGVGRGSLQGDARIVAHLRAFGCAASAGEATLAARGRPTRGAEVDLCGEPDLAPVLAAIAGGAALAGHSSRLGGLGTLEGKESPRLSVLAAALAQLGLAVEAGADFLRVGPGAGRAPAGELVLDPRGDHRMAFAFALLGLLRPGLRVRDPGCVAKSWPSFWEDLGRLARTGGAQ